MLENTEGVIKKGQFRETNSKTKKKQSKNTTHNVLDTTYKNIILIQQHWFSRCNGLLWNGL